MDLYCPEFSIEYLISLLQEDDNFYGLGLLERLIDFLKGYTRKYEKALIFLLTENRQRFKNSKDAVIKEIFGNCPFKELQQMVMWAEKLKDLLPPCFFGQISNQTGTDKLRIEVGTSVEFTMPKMESVFVNKVSGRNDSIQKSNFLENFNMRFEPGDQIPSCSSAPKQNKKIDTTLKSSDWLRSQYNTYKGSITHLSWENFFDYIMMTVSMKTSEESLQDSLFEMLGFDCFDLIQEIIQKRDMLLSGTVVVQTSAPVQSNSETKKTSEVSVEAGGARRRVPALSSQVVVNSQQEKRLEKRKRKLEKKMIKKGNGQDFAETFDHVERNLDIAKHEPLFKPVANHDSHQYKNVHDEQSDIYEKAMICGKPITIPINAKRTSNKKYEEVVIPAKEIVKSPVDTLSIDSLDSIGKMVFRGITHFNQIQSEVFPIAYNSNENMLVSAPTGAGKTNIALMTIVNQIKNYSEDGVILLHKLKIVYVCPMKALAAEMVNNFSKKLNCLGVVVKELTGDMQLTKQEIISTHMLVVTPEKWDVITRKGTADAELTNQLKLLIIDEIHLLNTDRGPIIEALVARTLRQVLSTQNMIRIIGLSATLPNYFDVAQFLRVDPDKGLFYFDSRYRSVPLEQTFIGVRSSKIDSLVKNMNEVCFNKVLGLLKKGHQVMVFVNARNETVRTANFFKDMASQLQVLKYFQPEDSIKVKRVAWKSNSNSNRIIEDLIQYGLGVHHAGMLRAHRNTVEKCFLEGTIKCLVCTATLAWGVNLPAHAVIIKGTSIYDSKRSAYIDMDILDVLQIFGRAGRPQYDSSGEAFIITSEEKFHHYLQALTNQLPIESKLLDALPDHLNAEVVLGTVTNVQEAIEWLTYTYFFRRIRSNPLVYGFTYNDLRDDPTLQDHLAKQAVDAAKQLDNAHMVRYTSETGELVSTNFGRTASHYYINYDTMVLFHEEIKTFMQESDIINMMCHCGEFKQIQVRPEELDELDFLKETCCEYTTPPVEDPTGKISVLMQTYLSHGAIKTSSLSSDMMYITQNVVRIARALFDIALNLNAALLTARCLTVAQMFDRQCWATQTPLRQYPDIPNYVILEIEGKRVDFQEFRDYTPKQIQGVINSFKEAEHVKQCAEAFPSLNVESNIFPITRGVIRIKLTLTPDFRWVDKFHGKACEVFWIWVENPDNNEIYHWESFAVSKKACINKEPSELLLTVQLAEPQPSQYLVQVWSDKWLSAHSVHPVSFRNLHVPEAYMPPTELLSLIPLSIKALNNKQYERLYNFTNFNPVQTQMFHCLYHTDNNILLGAPTGSGKTIVAEICILRLFNENPGLKVVYVAPLKALVRERVNDWKNRFGKILKKRVVELTGDVSPTTDITSGADIIITTPEKWDGITRGWQNRSYIRKVGLMIIDEIHLLGEDRGPILEVLVSRTNFITNMTGRRFRIVGLSTAMANAGDLAEWLQINKKGLYNFRSSVRPVPLEIHVTGFPGKHYCPRMISMNRPTYQAIRQHAPESPALVFCSSRKQTRLTASDLINYLAIDADPKQWLKSSEENINMIVSTISDPDLKHFLPFGIGIHHAGLQERDRQTVEELFVNQKIQVLIATATLAWGVNFPAHLVVIKGTEYYDGKTKRYVDMPITDVLQMMGRAGRPQYDTSGVACVFVHDIKKNFYKKFLFEPFPIESNLLEVLPEHINAEISSGTIVNRECLVEYIKWTYFFKRLLQNPTYYNLRSTETRSVQKYLNNLADYVLKELVKSNCVSIVISGEMYYEPTFFGHIASYYYLSHETVAHFQKNIKPSNTIDDLIQILCHSKEYSTFPVRHNEDIKNEKIIRDLGITTIKRDEIDTAFAKVYLLIQAHIYRYKLPNQEYVVDLKSVMDQIFRLLQALLDIVGNYGWLGNTIRVIQIMQMMIQGQVLDEPCLFTLPHISDDVLSSLEGELIAFGVPLRLSAIRVAFFEDREMMVHAFENAFGKQRVREVIEKIESIPLITVCVSFNEVIHTDDDEIRNELHPPYQLNLDGEYELNITLTRKTPITPCVALTRFPKTKDENWIICVGIPDLDEVLCIKRVTIKHQSSLYLKILTPSKKGHFTVSVFFMSDSYLGIDQQFSFPIKVVSNESN